MAVFPLMMLKTQLNRILAFLMVIITIRASYWVYFKYIWLLGFPDGYITELGYAESKLANIFLIVNFILGLIFLYLGISPSKRYKGIKLLVTIILYIVIAFYLSNIDQNYQLHLDHGQGG